MINNIPWQVEGAQKSWVGWPQVQWNHLWMSLQSSDLKTSPVIFWRALVQERKLLRFCSTGFLKLPTFSYWILRLIPSLSSGMKVLILSSALPSDCNGVYWFCLFLLLRCREEECQSAVWLHHAAVTNSSKPQWPPHPTYPLWGGWGLSLSSLL